MPGSILYITKWVSSFLWRRLKRGLCSVYGSEPEESMSRALDWLSRIAKKFAATSPLLSVILCIKLPHMPAQEIYFHTPPYRTCVIIYRCSCCFVIRMKMKGCEFRLLMYLYLAILLLPTVALELFRSWGRKFYIKSCDFFRSGIRFFKPDPRRHEHYLHVRH